MSRRDSHGAPPLRWTSATRCSIPQIPRPPLLSQRKPHRITAVGNSHMPQPRTQFRHPHHRRLVTAALRIENARQTPLSAHPRKESFHALSIARHRPHGSRRPRATRLLAAPPDVPRRQVPSSQSSRDLGEPSGAASGCKPFPQRDVKRGAAERHGAPRAPPPGPRRFPAFWVQFPCILQSALQRGFPSGSRGNCRNGHRNPLALFRRFSRPCDLLRMPM